LKKHGKPTFEIEKYLKNENLKIYGVSIPTNNEVLLDRIGILKELTDNENPYEPI
jgi:hypothetical protein